MRVTADDIADLMNLSVAAVILIGLAADAIVWWLA